MKTTGLVGGMSWSGLSGAPGERVSPLATVGVNATLPTN